MFSAGMNLLCACNVDYEYDVMMGVSPSRPGLVYDSRMQGHINEPTPSHPEMPDRVSRIWQALCDKRLVDRCLRVEVGGACACC